MAIEQTLSIIKPDGTARNLVGAILDRLEKAGLQIIAQKRTRLTPAQARVFYGVHGDRSFFQELCDYMSSGALVAQVLTGDGAIALYRDIMGATDPQKAEIGTLRRDYGLSMDQNTVHGSDSKATAAQEISFFFSQQEMFPA